MKKRRDAELVLAKQYSIAEVRTQPEGPNNTVYLRYFYKDKSYGSFVKALKAAMLDQGMDLEQLATELKKLKEATAQEIASQIGASRYAVTVVTR